jgi:phosphatidylinositol alpha 1,6-mannosyltransferase
VSTEAGGVPAILTHREHGLLAPLGDDRTLGRLMLDLLTDPATAGRYARAARQSIEGCTWSAVRDQWLRAYRSTLESATPHRAGKVAAPVSPR